MEYNDDMYNLIAHCSKSTSDIKVYRLKDKYSVWIRGFGAYEFSLDGEHIADGKSNNIKFKTISNNFTKGS